MIKSVTQTILQPLKDMKKEKKALADTTEARIKEAARKVFTTKGFAGAKTRDIAEEAGINLALLNYYFRSKEKLFNLIMMEAVQQFLQGVKHILEEENSLNKKVELIAGNYIDMLIENPDLPIFMLSEIRSRPEELINKMGMKGILMKSELFKQIKENAKNDKIHPAHYFMNTMSMIIFPFVARPIITEVTGLKDNEFTKLMQERKILIARWLESMLKLK